jgi:transcriptional regulator with XRE-family HTH domain
MAAPYHRSLRFVQSERGEAGRAAESFGDRLRRLRVARGFRVTDVAYAAGLTEGSIRQLESGQTKSVSLPVGLRIAKSLGVSPEYLATGTGPSDGDDIPTAPILSRLDDHERRIAVLEARLS